MSIELCSEKSSPVGIGSNNNTPPRISFSYDFLQSDVVPIEQRPLRSKSSGLNSSIDFDFCVRQISCYDNEPSSADELFSDGKILPAEIKKNPDRPTPEKPSPAAGSETPATPLSQAFPQTPGVREESGKSRSFWRFKRSSSCGSGGGYGRTLCPLPLLSRSNSTGSADETKPINGKSKTTSSPKESASKHVLKSHSSLKPPLKKNLGAYGNGVSINPVLNVTPANILAVGSIFSHGKSKSKKK